MEDSGGLWQRLVRVARTWQAIRLFVGVTVFALCALTAMLTIGFFRATERVDEVARIAERKRAEAHLFNFARSAAEKIKVQATWDEAFRNSRGAIQTAWTDKLFGNFLWSSFEYDPLMLVEPDGSVVRSWRAGKPAALGPDAAELGKALPYMLATERSIGTQTGTRRFGDLNWPVDVQQRPITRWSYAFIENRGGPALAVMVSILPDEDYSMLRVSPRRLVAVKRIDDAFLEAMGATTMAGQHRLTDPLAPSDGQNTVELRDPSGKSIAAIAWPSPPLNQQLRERMSPLFALYLGFWLLVALGGGAIVTILWRTSRELAISEAQAQHNSLHDAMTGLPNRTQFMRELQFGIDAAVSAGGPASLAVAYFDVDRFKMINDTMGHHVGDELVRQMAERLREQLPATDLLARLGGDEFVLLRHDTVTRAECEEIGTEIAEIVGTAFNIFGNLLHITVSVGLCRTPRNGRDAGTILRNADIAMYEAKQGGRACARVFGEAMDASLRWRHEVETELRQAISADQLSIAYQPIVHSDSNGVASLEALLRWNHPDKGAIGPGVFVPIAEQCGLMALLGTWVLRRVFTESRAWPDTDISINLSPLQIVTQGFLDNLRELIRETGVNPRRIVFEITEGVLLDTNKQVLGTLEKIKAMGFRIALDDFGTGYSSLSYLRSFKFDLIKIDRSFVQHIENDLNSQSILKAIVALGQSLKMKIVAEGVETLLQRQLVQSAGCQLIQGLYHWPALSFEETCALIDQRGDEIAVSRFTRNVA